jgi:glycosyltransferase involved in cell wall biosynthesis
MFRPEIILTTHHKNYDPRWRSRVVILPGYIQEWQRFGSHLPVTKSLLWGWRLFRLSRQFHAVVTGSERLALVFAALQNLRRHKVPHIFMQSMWDLPESRIARFVKRVLFRAVVGSASHVVVFSRRQLVLYPRELGLPRHKLVFLFSHTSLYDKKYPVSRGQYVFSGGDSNRDYRTLLAAAQGLDCPFKVVTHKLDGLNLQQLPRNIEVIAGLPSDEFNRMMAGAAAVVVPLRPGTLETGGRTVYANAMSMGKAVIVADDDAGDYITNEHDGLLVPSGDSFALNRAIARVLADTELTSRLETNAKRTAQSFAPESFFQSIFSLVDRSSGSDKQSDSAESSTGVPYEHLPNQSFDEGLPYTPIRVSIRKR